MIQILQLRVVIQVDMQLKIHFFLAFFASIEVSGGKNGCGGSVRVRTTGHLTNVPKHDWRYGGPWEVIRSEIPQLKYAQWP